MVPYGSLSEMLPNCEMNRFKLCWVKNWLKGKDQKVVVKEQLAVRWLPVVFPRA